MEKWLGYLDRFLNMIRPKAYNIIARSVIAAGIALLLSQANFVQAIIVSIYERFFGRSDVLRALLEQETSQWFGLTLVIFGVIYHFAMTVGQDLVTLKLQSAPKYPELTLHVADADRKVFSEDRIVMRGVICAVPRDADIPEHNLVAIEKVKPIFGLPLTHLLNEMNGHSLNRNYFKDRAKFLKVWGGAELIRFSLDNNSGVIAKNVSVEMVILKVSGVNADNTNDDFPSLPSERVDRYGGLHCYANPIAEHYSIKRSHTATEYVFTWDVGDVQANTSAGSSTCLFLRASLDSKIEISIYCDDLPEPVAITYEVVAPLIPEFRISLDDLKSSETEFNSVVDHVVMEGYLSRRVTEEVDRLNHEQQEFLP